MRTQATFICLSSWLLKGLVAARLVLVTQADLSSLQLPCLQAGFYGQYGRPLRSVHLVDQECLSESSQHLTSGSAFEYEGGLGQRLVWLQQVGVDESLQTQPVLSGLLTSESPGCDENEGLQPNSKPMDDQGTQHTLTSNKSCHPSAMQVLWSTNTSAIVAIPTSQLPIIDFYLPKYTVAVAIPTEHLKPAPVDPHAVHRIQSLISKLVFNPTISSIVSSLNTSGMRKDIRHLTGESDSNILSRHSFSQGAKDAANWIQYQLEQSGAMCEQRAFLTGFAPNVICRYPATTNSTGLAILSAHYDTRGSFGSIRAPGGDDDGSGTVHLLAIARVIKERGIAFRDNLELVAFAGEEQGLLGSHAYAEQLRQTNTNVTLHIQADMLAYHSPSEPPQLGLPDVIGLPEAAWLVGNMSQIYAPELVVGYTPACCSDHQSFHQYGFPATQVFERAGPILDPMYHNTGDVSNRTGYDLEQVTSIAKVTFATMLEIAGFELPEDAEI